MKTGAAAPMLLQLGFCPWHTGYRMLCQAIPDYRENRSQSMTKELYPRIARQFGNCGGYTAEHSIRYAVAAAWEQGNRAVWEGFFPLAQKAPSNLKFIATMAEYLP